MTDDSPGSFPPPSPKIDTTRPHSARIWNYWLGGKDHYPVDREAGEEYARAWPAIVDVARGTRYFLARAVRFLAGEAGIAQFLDVGAGLPTVDNTHELAQRIVPDARVVYVDNDPLVLAHARALLTSDPPAVTDYVDADVREPEMILAQAAKTLDFARPVAVMLLGILAQAGGYDQARAIVRRLMGATAPGSFLVIADGTDTSPVRNEAIRGYNERAAQPYRLRSPEQIAGYFDGLELVQPGVVPLGQWRPDPSPFAIPGGEYALCGVARKR